MLETTNSGHANAAVGALKECAEVIESMLPAALNDSIVKWSAGQGRWAAVPWISVLHPDKTATTQHGVYPVLLFSEDSTAVELTIAQGVTDLKGAHGRRAAVAELHRRAELLRPRLERLAEHGFALDSELDLGPSPLARDYVASTLAHKRFSRDSMSSEVNEAAEALLDGYADLLTSGALNLLHDRPKNVSQALMIYVGKGADANFETGGRAGHWGWKQPPGGLETLRPGDLVAFGRGYGGGSPRVDAAAWQGHSLRELVVGRILSGPERTDEKVMPDELAGDASYPWKIRFELLGSETDVSLAPGKHLSEQAGEAVRLSAITQGVGKLVPVEGSPHLERYLTGPTPVPITPDQLAEAATTFARAVEESGVRLPAADVQAFFAALAAKPFAILTGQSGSGKTQLAMRLGEWLGADGQGRPRCHVVPVRPDWTGPEYLFGYPDALRSTAEHEVWAVPDSLEFILRAHNEPTAPYLLVLDEMNLAHVERYFADFLSGLESRQPVLPELQKIGGQWKATGNSQRLPLPRNLMVVGTVNVDETTYMFSPKVLDRAFVFEFRTRSGDLDPTARKPVTVAEAPEQSRAALLGVLLDDEWHHSHPHPEAVSSLAPELVALHDLLSPTGHDFGHRVFYEALRFAAMLAALGLEDLSTALDRIPLTKVLPKMHGTRSRVEQPLRDLRAFAGGDEDANSGPRLLLTARKLDRMLETVAEAQFVSFAE